MNGGYIHDRNILDPLVHAFQETGAKVQLQSRSHSAGHIGYCDLTARFPDGLFVAVEIEMTTRRIANDIQKAIDLGADELWVVVPNQKVLRASRQRLQQLAPGPDVPVFILTLPQALKRVSDCIPLL
ncbi:hypothetical protein [Bythopirellula polymerisocia]|uniref:Restriction endonuclease type IV Mrr domain-containing protein n=1 Tax=Bythopirellula polymerisocia TaxID=2528003 RepID=A0A5C6CD57_9BACT|nr:hypothetical protein [Bythopirellula polymerisocia]TWU21316.1 hypothetical protein Pla144_47260 [Bythopirellula polymerisocia]